MTLAPSPAAGRVLVEICLDDLAGVLAAERAGADRVELCANLVEGGTTPSQGLIESVLESATRIGVQIMVRPRGGDFVVDASELRVMRADVRAISRHARTSSVPVGIVLGVLRRDGRIDEDALATLIQDAGDTPVTFHMAFDKTPDLIEAYDVLHRHGVVRVLTSGGAATASLGRETLAALVERSAHPGAPVVLAGGSVRAENVAELRHATGVHEVHLRAQVPSPTDDAHLVTDEDLVARTVAAVRATEDGAPLTRS